VARVVVEMAVESAWTAAFEPRCFAEYSNAQAEAPVVALELELRFVELELAATSQRNGYWLEL